MTLEQLQEKMAKLVQEAYELGLKEGSGGVITMSSKARPVDAVEVYAYMRLTYPQLGDKVNWTIANKWFDYFSSNGFKVGGKAPMKDWKASVRNWDKSKELEQASRQQIQQPQRYTNR